MQGFVEDGTGAKVATLKGKWDDNMYYTLEDDVSKTKGVTSPQKASLLWQRSKPPSDPTRYNLSSFAITLNELTPELQVYMTQNSALNSSFGTLIHLYLLF